MNNRITSILLLITILLFPLCLVNPQRTIWLNMMKEQSEKKDDSKNEKSNNEKE